MTNRVVDISDSGCRLKVRLEQLVIEPRDGEASHIPLEDVAVVCLANPAVTCTQPALAALAEHGAMVVVCNGKGLPVGWLTPAVGHHLQTERMALQINASEPKRKRVWQQIVRRKIEGQSAVLKALRDGDQGLSALVKEVKSGDPSNVEARASRKYWPILFGKEFRRDREAEGINALLNYGYTITRAIAARAVCSAGLHPSIGLQHKNRYNAYVLADDFMEPWRPLVDHAVAVFCETNGPDQPVNTRSKRYLLTRLLGWYTDGGEARTLFDWSSRAAVSLVSVFDGAANDLELPRVLTEPVEV